MSRKRIQKMLVLRKNQLERKEIDRVESFGKDSVNYLFAYEMNLWEELKNKEIYLRYGTFLNETFTENKIKNVDKMFYIVFRIIIMTLFYKYRLMINIDVYDRVYTSIYRNFLNLCDIRFLIMDKEEFEDHLKLDDLVERYVSSILKDKTLLRKLNVKNRMVVAAEYLYLRMMEYKSIDESHMINEVSKLFAINDLDSRESLLRAIYKVRKNNIYRRDYTDGDREILMNKYMSILKEQDIGKWKMFDEIRSSVGDTNFATLLLRFEGMFFYIPRIEEILNGV